MRSAPRPLVAACVVVLAGAFGTRAVRGEAAERDDPKAEAKGLVDEALKAYEGGRFGEAGILYLRAFDFAIAHALGEKPALLYNAGLAFERAEQCDRAVELFRRYLEKKADATAQRKLAKAQACAPDVVVETRPSGARVFVDGNPRGDTPVSIPVTAGDHMLRLELEGYGVAEESFAVKRGKSQSIVRALEKKPPPVVAEPVAPEADPKTAEPKMAEAKKVEPAPTEPEREPGSAPKVMAAVESPPRTGVWIAGGSAIVLAAGGAILRGVSIAKVHQYESDLEAELMKPSAERDSSKVRAGEQSARTFAAASDVVFGAAVVAAGVAVVMYLMADGDAGASLAVGPGRAAVGVRF